VTPADVCDAIKFCDAIAHAISWDRVGAVVAALAFTYGAVMSVAFAVHVFRGQRIVRRTSTRTTKGRLDKHRQKGAG
jgi:hypothetical protein